MPPGRGLSVLLVEKDDLAAHTSSWSTKLIHGGLRYLEHYEFRLVAEALAEREVLLRAAPHIIEPLLFVLPHEPHLRPAWMIRAGLFLYDHLGGRMTLPKSFGVDLDGTRYGAGLKPRFTRGFAYADARVDDARLVVCNAIDARSRGADIRVRTMLAARARDNGCGAQRSRRATAAREVTARAIVNAAGPWVCDVLRRGERCAGRGEGAPRQGQPHRRAARARRAARVHPAERRQPHRVHHSVPGALFADRHDRRARRDVRASGDQRGGDVLPADAREHVSRAAARQHGHRLDVQRRAAALRRRDDGSFRRHARLRAEARHGAQRREGARAPVLSVFGGKITTYRKLAEAALAELEAVLSADEAAHGRAMRVLPGGDLPQGDRDAWLAELARALSRACRATLLRALAHRHGTRATAVLGDAASAGDLGEDFGAGLTEREVDYLRRRGMGALRAKTSCGGGPSAGCR